MPPWAACSHCADQELATQKKLDEVVGMGVARRRSLDVAGKTMAGCFERALVPETESQPVQMAEWRAD